MPAIDILRRYLPLMLLAATIGIAWLCYRPALGGSFQLDDASNLGGLANVTETEAAIDFVTTGTAGPLGRPLALVTFALQADSWPDDPQAFLQFNIVLHLFNAVILAACLNLLAAAQGVEPERSRFVAAAGAGLWVMLPLLATASLLVVQRMTTLAALFTLLGILGYLVARRRLYEAPRRALIGMSVSVIAGTALAALSKESGLLLPLLLLVIEATVLDRPPIAPRTWRLWSSLFLVVPAAVVIVYLATRISYPEYVVARRGFDAGERLLTEARILWIYLHKAVVGLPARLGIYQGPPAVARSLLEPTALLATLAWIVVLVFALLGRRRTPLFAFAVLWFAAGHLLESTVIPLELYFEHRNYLPVVGPVYALACAVVTGPRMRERVGAVVVPLVVVANAFLLYSFASLWGEPSLASRYWAMRYPESVRAVTNLATYQLTEEGVPRAMQTLRDFSAAYPEHAYLHIQVVNLGCQIAPEIDRGADIARLESELTRVTFTYTAGTMLGQLFATTTVRDCPGLDATAVIRLAEALRSNPRYAGDPAYNRFHHKLLASIARHRGDFEATLAHLEDAIAHRPSSELNMMMVTSLADRGDFDRAREFIENARNAGPKHPLRSIVWHRDLDDLVAYVSALEQAREPADAADRSETDPL